jgi:DNA-3-methyladenine glycosylase
MSLNFDAKFAGTDRPLPADFYEQEPHELARALLGRDVVRVLDDGAKLRGRIVELEVYGHILDPASHSHSGVPTERTAAMFGEPGSAYVYLIYGMYHCLNVVAPSAERPSALLLRALHPIEGLDRMAERRGLADRYEGEMSLTVKKNLLSGPGKLCQAMEIDTSFNEHPLSRGPLYISEGAPEEVREAIEVVCGTRVGLNPTTVGECCEWPWRYGVGGSRFLSRRMTAPGE